MHPNAATFEYTETDVWHNRELVYCAKILTKYIFSLLPIMLKIVK